MTSDETIRARPAGSGIDPESSRPDRARRAGGGIPHLAGRGADATDKVPSSIIDTLLRDRAALPASHPDHHRLRERAIHAALPMAAALARQYANRGESLADLRQVAAVGLLKAIDGFDPAYRNTFRTYAIPKITGEIKRHLRDNCWPVHVPRRYRDLRQDVGRCRDALTQLLRRMPRVADIAEHLGTDHADVVNVLLANSARASASLTGMQPRPEQPHPLDRCAVSDRGYELVDLHESISVALAGMSYRDRQIIAMRFYAEMSQSRIAAELGVSQMQVSRLLADILRRLRENLGELV